MSDALPVRAVRWHGKNVFEIQLERQGLAYVPGDCLALFTADGRVSRPYSLASGTSEDILRFVIRLMPGGTLSTYLSERRAGDVVRVSPPFGWFRPGEHAGERPFCFIATGTGVAPFLACLRSLPVRKPVSFLYGVREWQDAIDADWLRAQAPVEFCVSRERVEGTHHGRVTDELSGLPVGDEMDYYLCGLDAMIDEVTAWLEKRGVPITRIHRECFFNASYTS